MLFASENSNIIQDRLEYLLDDIFEVNLSISNQ